MEINSLQNIEKALSEAHKVFNKTTAPIRSLLDDPISQFDEAMKLIRESAKDTDEERHAIEVLAVAFRRGIASIVLLSRGLLQEAFMVLRNALELMLIAIDITYCSKSLGEWKSTASQQININYDEWSFKKPKICKRISDNEGKVYPQFEREMALKCIENKSEYGICKQWEVISNKFLHAHSQAQIRKLFKTSGVLTFLGKQKLENYRQNFENYQTFIHWIILLLVRIPKYRRQIRGNTSLSERAKILLAKIDADENILHENS